MTEPAELRVNGEIRSFGASWVERVNRRLTGNTGRSKVLVRKTRSALMLGHDNGGMFGLGNRLNNPSPTEIAILIDRPGSATTSRDFYPPLIVISRDCECVRDSSGHHHSAKDSTEKDVYQFFHFSFFIIEDRLQCGLLCGMITRT